MLKRTDYPGSRLFIQKLNPEFKEGGSELLRVYNMPLASGDDKEDSQEDAPPGLLGKDAKLIFKVSRSQAEGEHHAHNFQNPLTIEDVDPDNMNCLRIDALKPEHYAENPQII